MKIRQFVPCVPRKGMFSEKSDLIVVVGTVKLGTDAILHENGSTGMYEKVFIEKKERSLKPKELDSECLKPK